MNKLESQINETESKEESESKEDNETESKEEGKSKEGKSKEEGENETESKEEGENETESKEESETDSKDSTETENTDVFSAATTTTHYGSLNSSLSTFSYPSSAPSSSINLTNLVYKRHPRNPKKRTIYTDILKNIGKKRMPFAGEFKFRQYNKIRYFEGSHPDTTPRNRSMIPKTDHYDITMISQTS